MSGKQVSILISLLKTKNLNYPPEHIFSRKFGFLKLIVSLYRFVPNRCPAARIKWESGENPEQSRCCKPIRGQAHFSHCLCGDGKAPGPGKSEDLQNDFFQWLSRN